MRTLIDGYNLMYARGLLGRRLGPDGLRKVRNRFLNDLAAALGPIEAHQTTVVFDAAAATAPEDRPAETSHKGLTVVFAVGDDCADERIELLIAGHATPKALAVVSSDHRVRLAAVRRRAKAVTAEEFLDRLEAPRRTAPAPSPPTAEDRARLHGPTAQEAAYWREEFRDVADDLDTLEALYGPPALLTDEEIARIEREVELES